MEAQTFLLLVILMFGSVQTSTTTMKPTSNSTVAPSEASNTTSNSTVEASNTTSNSTMAPSEASNTTSNSTEVPTTTMMTTKYPRVISAGRALEVSGYYGKMMNITCHGNNFAFKEVIYGYPQNSSNSCQNESLCFTNNRFWSFMKNKEPQKCSGKSTCLFPVTWDQDQHLYSILPKCQNASINPCFQKLKGECIYEEKKINFCDAKSISGSNIYIHNPDSGETGDDYECDCTVHSQENIVLDAIMFTLSFNKTQNCSSSFVIDDGNNNLTLPCNDSRKFETIKSGSSKFKLTLTKLQNQTYQIWLRVRTDNHIKVTVDCNKKEYLGNVTTVTPTTMMTTKSYKDFWKSRRDNTIKVASWVAGGIAAFIVITLCIITVITYRRFANIAGRINKPPKSSHDELQNRGSIEIYSQ